MFSLYYRPWQWVCARLLSLAMALFLALAPVVPDALADTGQRLNLSFEDAQAIARQQAPVLTAGSAQLQARQNSALAAGELPDPTLTGGLVNLPISGGNAFSLNEDFMTMETIGIMQRFTHRDKREAQSRLAEAETFLASTRLRLAEIQLQTDVAMGWINRREIEQQLNVLDELLEENQHLQESVNAQIAGGRGVLADSILPREQHLLLEERRDQLLTRHQQAIATLEQWLGEAAHLPLSGHWPQWQIDGSALRSNLRQHPAFALFEPRTAILDAELARAKAAKKSDWSVELSYGHRASPFSDMMSMKFTMDLPLFSERRQDPLIAAKYSELEQLSAESEASLRLMTSELERHLAEMERLQRAVERQETGMLPLAADRVALLQDAWRDGQAPLSELVQARLQHGEARLRLIALQSEHSRLAAVLHFSHGSDVGHEHAQVASSEESPQ